jgi:hypothetical protein
MRIESKQIVAGFSAVQIRRLIRETVGRSISPRCVREVLQCSESTAATVLVDLQCEGLFVQVEDHIEPSLQGRALAQATAAKPLVRGRPGCNLCVPRRKGIGNTTCSPDGRRWRNGRDSIPPNST